MRGVMRDRALEERFQKDGYVEIPFISSEEVAALTQQFFELLPTSGGNILASETGVVGGDITYDFTFIDKNIAYKEAVYKVITEYFKPHVAKWLDDYRPIIANYIRKKTEGGEVPMHQNWAFVEERKYTSVSIWCPLVDSTIENGTLQVVPRSHKRFGEVRGPMIPWELEGIKQDIINQYLVPLEVKAGNAIILDDSIVHYSAINKTNELRLAIQLILVPEEVPSIHYHINSNRNPELVEVLAVDTEFYMQFNPWKQPDDAKRIRTFSYQPQSMSLVNFKKVLEGERFDIDVPKGIISRIKAMIGS